MATIKKAQLGGLIRKAAKAVIKKTPKKTISLAEKVKANKLSGGLTKAEQKIGKDADKGSSYDVPSKPVVLTAEQKANNARILKEIKEGKRKNGGKISKAQGGIRIPKQLEQKGKPDARNSGLAIDTTSVPKGFKKLPGKPISSPDYKPSKRKYKTGGMISKMRNGGSLSGLTASNKRVGPVDPKGSWTKVQEKTLAGARGKAKLTADKQLGATKMAKRGMNISKKK